MSCQVVYIFILLDPHTLHMVPASFPVIMYYQTQAPEHRRIPVAASQYPVRAGRGLGATPPSAGVGGGMFRSRTISLNLVMWRPRNSPCRLTCSGQLIVRSTSGTWHTTSCRVHYPAVMRVRQVSRYPIYTFGMPECAQRCQNRMQPQSACSMEQLTCKLLKLYFHCYTSSAAINKIQSSSLSAPRSIIVAAASEILAIEGVNHCCSPAAPPLLRPAPPHPHQCLC